MLKRSIACLAPLLSAVLLAVLALAALRPPAIRPADAGEDRFSAERACEHLSTIARQPRAMGTEGHEQARRDIADELEATGLEVDLQTATSMRQGRAMWPSFGTVINVAGRLKGRQRGQAILLVSHYDTTPTSPGAADNGAGVAALLETARALRAGAQPRNDIIFLFTDGEEEGLLGATAFLEQHPWAQDVEVVLNFEARGTSGPSVMFETGPDNRRWIEALRQAVKRPVAVSYASEIYRRLPNNTDFSAFRHAGLTGLNFAFFDGAHGYHNSRDSLENLDLRSVQHHGDYALGLARFLGDTELQTDTETRGNAVYFDLLGSILVSYPESWALPVVVLLAVVTLGLLVLAPFRHRLGFGGLFGSLIVNLAGAWLTGLLLGEVAKIVHHPTDDLEPWSGPGDASLLALALIAASLALNVSWLVAKRVSAESSIAAGLLVWLALATVSATFAPGASYLFAVPLAASLPAIAIWIRDPPQPERVRWLLVALLALAAGACALLWTPALALIGTAAGAPAARPLGAVVFVIVFGLLAPQSRLAACLPRRWLLPGAAIALGLVVLAAIRLGSGHDETHPRPNSILYLLDAEEEQARWLSLDPALDRWTRQFLPDAAKRSDRPAFLDLSRPAFAAPAAMAPMTGATVELLGTSTSQDGRVLELSVDWTTRVHRAIVFLRSEGAIRAVSIDGRRATRNVNSGPGDAAYRMAFTYQAPPPTGLRLQVETGEPAPLEVEVIDQRYGLPAIEGFADSPRDAGMRPRQHWATDSTFVRTVTRLETVSDATTTGR